MKNNFLLAILCLLTLGIATGCRKEPPIDDENLNNSSTSNQAASNIRMSAKINGTAWQATDESLQYNSLWRSFNSGNCKTLTIQSKSAEGRAIYLTAEDKSTAWGHGIKIKTYYYEGNISDYASLSVGPGFDYLTKNGKIDITACDTVQRTVSGTFEFKAYNKNNPADTLRVTNGILNRVKYNVY